MTAWAGSSWSPWTGTRTPAAWRVMLHELRGGGWVDYRVLIPQMVSAGGFATRRPVYTLLCAAAAVGVIERRGIAGQARLVGRCARLRSDAPAHLVTEPKAARSNA